MKTLQYTFRVAVLCSAALLALTAPAFGQFREKVIPPPKNDAEFLKAFRAATAEASKSTVRVLSDGKEAALGTIVGDNGWILTKYSQLNGKVTVKLKDPTTKMEGDPIEAKIVGVNQDFDLAMLKVEAKGLPAVKFTESKVAPVGNWVASVGPSEDPVAVGVMSVATRNVGANGFRDTRNPKRGYLGIEMEPVEGGVRIKDVKRRSPADKAGMLVNDKIVAVNGQEVTGTESMQDAMNKTKAGDEVTIKVKRKGKDGEEERELKAKLEKLPADRSDFQNNMGSELSDRRTGFPTFFQHDTVVPPKECGGPVCDLDGHVLGINIARAGRVESYAIPSEIITGMLPDLQSGKLAPKPEVVKVDLDKKMAELKAALKKAEEEAADAEKQLVESKEVIKKLEEAKAAAEKKLKEAKEALEKAEKEKK